MSFHKDAPLAHQASLAAKAQGKFWEYHDLLFANMSNLKKKKLLAHAKTLKLDMKKFKAALDKKTFEKVVDQELEDGKQVKVQGTPTTFINGRKLDYKKGEKPKAALARYIKEELEAVKPLVKKGLKGDKLYYELVGKPEESDSGDTKKKEKKNYPYVAVGDAPSKGDDDAPVTLVEFSDFRCGFCSGAAKVMGQLGKAYGDKLRIVFKNYPLSQANFPIAQAALAAHQQGKFWEFHDMVFADQKKTDRDTLLGYAKSLELDLSLFKQTMDSPVTKAQVEADQAQGRKLKLQGTPSFFLDNRPLGSVQGFKAFMKEINKALVKKGYKKKDLPTGPPPVQIAMVDVPFKGPENAPVTIVEYSDFE